MSNFRDNRKTYSARSPIQGMSSQSAGEAEYADPNSNYWRQEVDTCKDRISALPISYEEKSAVVEKHLPGFIGDRTWQWIACQFEKVFEELSGGAK